ncbi:MAG: PEP-CTERM sorting domain-containing protein, partial [Planctomycetota bacterium]
RGAGEYTPGTDMRTMGAAALGWVGTMGVDGFGVAHSGSSGNFLANDLGEDSPAVTYEQGGRMQWIGVGNFPFDRNITRQLNPTVASDEWWFSIMTNRLGWSGGPADNTFTVGGFTDASGNGLQVGYDDSLGQDSMPDLVLRANGVNNVLAADTASSDNQLVIVQMLIDQAGDETLNVWVDPASLSPVPGPDLTIMTDLTSSLTPFTQSKYESPGQSGVVFFDEIRLGLDFQSVTGVPEPGSVGLVLTGLALIGLRRRR